MARIPAMLAALSLIAAACGSGNGAAEPTPTPATAAPAGAPVATPAPEVTEDPPPERARLFADGSEIPPAPQVPAGPLDPAVIEDLDIIFGALAGEAGSETIARIEAALTRLSDSGDARIGWLISDLLRFVPAGVIGNTAVAAFEKLTGAEIPDGPSWGPVTDHMIAWDLPAPPGYVGWKRVPFELIEPAWAPFFDDADADIDWRLLSWGGVVIDNRPIDEAHLPCPRRCIPALNDPGVTDAVGGGWYPGERLVFGVVVNGEARAYPKHIMETHEMVNDTLGGRRIGIPYCTLCGSAQAYFTDVVPTGFETIELRTSGLLSRSNKVMFDLNTFSVFDTFLGTALSGRLQDESYQLEMITMITTTWEEWKDDYPDTTIVAEDGGIGRIYNFDPLRGRDDDGPIFPIGDVDQRLPVQAQVVGVVTDDGTAVAFDVEQAQAALANDDAVELAGVRVLRDGGGLRVETTEGTPLVSHQSFWFAWSQFHPDTLVWTPLSL